ncbi:hypothetical protein UA08_04013 [Talaromyces atroroseus]|uniref:GPI anchored protein n=1 Tax=Talaromyces atroroseus TaxID=1441469 RepID=A0A1Q5Q878_TALAT|nr:hypothetical protein UA08_04013 [Talaromyces atroroseus]OKL60338.1 hypothetical protein UA08_04013 [Talaromyces atroroseus]
MHSAMALALMSSVVAAENVVTTLFLPGFDQQPLVASIVGGDSSATTYSIGCADGTPSDECGAGNGFTLIEGPETASMEMVVGASSILFVDLACDLNTSVSQAVCTETDGGSEANFPGVTTSTFAPDDYASAWLAVTVTAGSASGAPATTAASATAPTASATNSGTTAAATSSADSTAAASSGMTTVASTSSSGSSATAAQSSSSSSSSVSTGGMPQITGNAQWAVGGAAIAMAFAAL